MKTKKLLSILLSVLLLCGVIPLGTFTAGAATEGYYTYSISNCEVTITGCSTSISGDITVPSTLGGYPVTSIGSNAFSECGSLTGITFPKNIASIGDLAFYKCVNLKSIAIPDGVTGISFSLFENCYSLKSVTIPNSVINIYGYAFYNCSSLTDVYYKGTDEQWNKINVVPSGNGPLANSKIHFPLVDTDLNADGIVGAEDIVIIKQALLNSRNNDLTYDVNGDGKTDILDLIRLKKLIAETGGNASVSVVYKAMALSGSRLNDLTIDFSNGKLDCGVGVPLSEFSEEDQEGFREYPDELSVFNGVEYYIGMGDGWDLTYNINGDIIDVICTNESMGNYVFSLKRTTDSALEVISVSEKPIYENYHGIIVGLVFTK